MTIIQQGQINTTALIVPDLYVQVVPPAISNLNGVPSDILGIVGTAQWGPVNAPITVANMLDFSQKFGQLQNRTYDLGTAAAVAVQQGAANMRCVRVSDGTDVAATGTLTAASAGDATAIAAAINAGQTAIRGPSALVVASTSTTTVTITAKYTGTLGNSLAVSIGAGSKATSTKVTIALPGGVPEVFDNIGTASATAATATMTSGTDGVGTITSAVLMGQDTAPRKGLYALRNTGCAVAFLADVSDTSTFANQLAYALSEGTYMIGVTPVSDTISNAVSTKATAGIDSFAFKYLLGDWIYWLDTVNAVTRLVSPQGFVAGCLVALAPQQTALNKPVYGVVGTQRSAAGLFYSRAELAQLGAASIDCICNPIPAGNQFGVRFGHNSSSNAMVGNDAYSRMTNYLGFSFNSVMGKFVGQLQSQQKNDPLRMNVGSVLMNFLTNMKQQGQIDSFTVQCDTNNNPPSRITLGYLQADVVVKYLSVVEKFLINMQGGNSVSITSQSISSVN